MPIGKGRAVVQSWNLLAMKKAQGSSPDISSLRRECERSHLETLENPVQSVCRTDFDGLFQDKAAS